MGGEINRQKYICLISLEGGGITDQSLLYAHCISPYTQNRQKLIMGPGKHATVVVVPPAQMGIQLVFSNKAGRDGDKK